MTSTHRSSAAAEVNEEVANPASGKPRHEAAPDDKVRTTVRGLFGRDSAYVAIWSVQLVTAALFTPVTTRVLGAATFGTVAAATSLMQVLFAFGVMGLQTAVQRNFAGPDGEEKARRLLGLAIVVAAVVTVAVDAAGRFWGPAIGFASYEGPARLAVLWAGTAAVTGAALALLRSRDKLLVFSIVSLIQSVAAEALALGLVLSFHRSATTFILGELLAQGVALVIALTTTAPRLVRVRDLPLVRSAFRYSLPLVPSALAAFVVNTSDRLVVLRDLGPTQVGRYQVAYNVGALSIALLGAMNSAWLPRLFAVEDLTTHSRLLSVTRDAVRRILFPVALGLSVGAPLVLRVWIPASYQPDGLLVVVVVVVVSAFPYADSLAYTRVLLATDRTHLLAASFAVAAAVNLALNIALVPSLGLPGSAAATWFAFIVLSELNRSFAARGLYIEPATARLHIAVAGVYGACLATVLLPTSTTFLLLRAGGSLICLLWFGKQLRRLASYGGARPPSGPLRRRVDPGTVPTEA